MIKSPQDASKKCFSYPSFGKNLQHCATLCSKTDVTLTKYSKSTLVRSCLNERKYEKNEEKTEKLREIGVGCLLSRAIGKSRNLKGERGESLIQGFLEEIKDLLVFLLKSKRF